MLRTLESIVRFVPDIDTAAAWYAELLGSSVRHENPQYAFIHVDGLTIGFHPADSKCPGGIGGTTVYWEVPDIDAAIRHLEQRGAVLHRGPVTTDFGARAAILLDPFGCTIGLNQGSARSRALICGG
ncbi:VOC family protein [Thauera sp. Sel9]|uniref:VOC family protein n=1 Tax=Thauera sp. Sel9 TaxID=2974299 RepID=UPI0021E19750|nr:VOC family protein [Thauera sp. Sel9]MCV2215963.1 VOC family protein [Thauera sp. Sel9]